MGNESQHTFHTNEIDEVFQNGILRYIGLMIGLMYIQPSKQSEMDEVFQNGIFQYIRLMIGLKCIQPLYAIQEVSHFDCSSCNKVPFALLVRQSRMNTQHTLSIWG